MTAPALIEAPSPNFDQRRGPIDMLILHYTGMPTGAAALARMRDPAAKVSAHYMIEEDGRIFRLVAEDRRAWHAGVASWGDKDDVNSRSIGVELVNPGHEWGYRAFPAAQMAACRALCLEILAHHHIPAHHVLGHSDVAPDRKQDPGELFDWAWLARQGVGLWPDLPEARGTEEPLTGAALEAFLSDLAAFGYDLSAGKEAGLAKAVDAYHRHFRPVRLGRAPDTQSARIVRALNDAAMV